MELKVSKRQARLLASGSKFSDVDPTGRLKAISQMSQSEAGKEN